jgi:glucosamine-phosphate N-acetyltransferase
MIFTKLSVEDYDGFKNLLKDFRPTDFSFDDFKENLNHIEQSKVQEIFIAKDEGKILGTITLIHEKKFIFDICSLTHIEDVCVKKEDRNKGIGKFLILNAIEICREKKSYKVTLNCSTENIEFYLKCGLERRGVQMSKLI